MGAKIAILLCTFHGEAFLIDQLNSFDQQTHHDWKLYVSDDSSDETTYAILSRFQLTHAKDKVCLLQGPRQGFAANFLSLACNETIVADYYAFSDQDDCWEPDKLARAIEWLQNQPANIPAIYCSRTQLINEQGEVSGLSTYFKKRPSFANALVQNIAGGNTMVFNHAARKILLLTGAHIDIPAHDWWLYIAVTACGGTIKYDSYPSVRYRQHEHNVIGFKTGLINRTKSIKMLIKGRFKSYNEKHIKVLNQLLPYMTDANRRIFNDFAKARNAAVLQRFIGVYRSGIYRQTLIGNIGLAIAALINRF